MKRIDIYIYTACHARKTGPAVYRAILEYVSIKTNLLIDEGQLEDTTKNRAVVEAALRALHRIKKGEQMEITIHTESEYFMRILKDLNRYADANWQKANKQDIKNADLWKQIYVFATLHKLRCDINLDKYNCKTILEGRLQND